MTGSNARDDKRVHTPPKGQNSGGQDLVLEGIAQILKTVQQFHRQTMEIMERCDRLERRMDDLDAMAATMATKADVLAAACRCLNNPRDAD